MARTRTLLQLRTEVRNRGDFQSVRHTDAELTRSINESIAELYDLLVSSNKDYYLDSKDYSVVAGTDTYALPTDFYKVVGVDVQDSSRWRLMRRFNWSERNQLQESAATKWNTRYRVMGSNLRLRPSPSWTGTIRFWYIPAPAELVNDGDTFDGIAGWEEYVITDCVIKGRVKDEDDVRDLLIAKEKLEKRIKHESHERDDGEPDRVRDVTAEDDYPHYPSYHRP
jgi:hypothetical protein